MSVEVYSTTLKDGEALDKINAWLNGFRGDELLKFHALRTSTDTLRIVIEADRSNRLRIQSTSPPHGAYLKLGTVPYVDVTFTEEIETTSFSSEVTYNGDPIPTNKFSFPDSYSMRIDTAGLGVADAGQHEFVFNSVKHKNKVWPLVGENKLVWTTSTIGGTKGGDIPEDPDVRALQMSKISIDKVVTEQQMMVEFYNRMKLKPEDVVGSTYLAGYPEFNKTTLLLVHRSGYRLPLIRFVTPRHGACMNLNGTASPPQYPLTMEIGFSDRIETSALGSIDAEFDGEPPTSIEVSDDRKLVTITGTPNTYKHHYLKLSGIRGTYYPRSSPFMYAFVVHTTETSTVIDHGSLTGLEDDDHPLYILHDGTRAFTGIVRLPTFVSPPPVVNGGIYFDGQNLWFGDP